MAGGGYCQQVRRTLLAGALAATLVAPVQPGAPASAAPAPRRIVYTGWTSTADFQAGTLQGAAVSRGRLVMDAPVATRNYAGRRYDVAQWVSPWRTPGFGLTELIASWNARTPGNSWIEVQVRGRTGGGRTSSWDVLGRWAADERFIHRTSVRTQGDDLADVNVDTWRANTAVTGWQLRVLLMRGRGAPSPAVEGNSEGIEAPPLPTAWVNSLDLFRRSKIVREAFSSPFQEVFSRLKHAERSNFERIVTPLDHLWYAQVA